MLRTGRAAPTSAADPAMSVLREARPITAEAPSPTAAARSAYLAPALSPGTRSTSRGTSPPVPGDLKACSVSIGSNRRQLRRQLTASTARMAHTAARLTVDAGEAVSTLLAVPNATKARSLASRPRYCSMRSRTTGTC